MAHLDLAIDLVLEASNALLDLVNLPLVGHLVARAVDAQRSLHQIELLSRLLLRLLVDRLARDLLVVFAHFVKLRHVCRTIHGMDQTDYPLIDYFDVIIIKLFINRIAVV